MLFTTANCWVERCHSEFSALSPGMATVLKESVKFCAKMYLGNVKSCIRNHLAKWLQSISLPVSRRCGNAEEVQNTITELRSQLPNIDEWSRGNPGGGGASAPFARRSSAATRSASPGTFVEKEERLRVSYVGAPLPSSVRIVVSE